MKSSRQSGTPLMGTPRSLSGMFQLYIYFFALILYTYLQNQAKQGKKTYRESDIHDKIDPFRKKVDDLLEVDAMNAATSDEDQSGDE
jgi:hypothetical protein